MQVYNQIGAITTIIIIHTTVRVLKGSAGLLIVTKIHKSKKIREQIQVIAIINLSIQPE
jgi:hypothetical protein